MLFDLPLEHLRSYRPERDEPHDFDAFWQQTLAETHQHRLDAQFEAFETGLRLIDVFDVTFRGYGGHPIKAWLLLPRERSAPLPCVVEYIGYGGGRGHPFDQLLWSNLGCAHLVMDTRGQGSTWRVGDTPDPGADGNPQIPGFMTRGILDPRTYYYRRVFTDGIRAVETARSYPAIDPQRVAVAGISQGGGIALAVAGQVPDLAAAMIDVPFLCHYRRATEIVDTFPYQELALYCQRHRDKIETVFNTLRYFDGMQFAARATTTALFSTALMDQVCPPSTVFAAYNHYAGPKQIEVWPYNGHEGGETFQNIKRAAFLAERWA